MFILTSGSYIDYSLQLHNPFLSLLVAVTLQKKKTAPFEYNVYNVRPKMSINMADLLFYSSDIVCRIYVTGHLAVAIALFTHTNPGLESGLNAFTHTAAKLV